MDKTKLMDWLARIKATRFNLWAWVLASMLAGFIAYYWDASDAEGQRAEKPGNVETASTFIPSGYVLVPIEVSNYEALDSILGNFGVVDLYLPADEQNKRARKVGERLKILRAPLNPSHFAVLARDTESARIVSHPGPFMVIVQNPSTNGTGFVSEGESLTSENAGDSSQANSKGRGKRSARSRITVEVTNEDEGS